MAFVRCYTGADGQSHFEDLDLLPPDVERSIEQTASAPSRSYCRVKALQFDACVGSGELPVCLGVVVIAVLLPGGDFLDQRLLVGDPPIEALA